MASKVSKKLKAATIDKAFGQYCSGIQVPILKIGAIYKIGEAAFDETGGDVKAVGEAMKTACEFVAVNQ